MAQRIKNDQDNGFRGIQAVRTIVHSFKKAGAFDGAVLCESSDGHNAWDAKLKTAQGLGMSFIATRDDDTGQRIYRLEFHMDEIALNRFKREDVSVNEEIMGKALEKLQSAKLIPKKFGYEDDDASLSISGGTATATFDSTHPVHILYLATVIAGSLAASGNRLFLYTPRAEEITQEFGQALSKLQAQNKKGFTSWSQVNFGKILCLNLQPGT